MDITLEQAKVFDAVARLGTAQKAGTELHKGHSAILYALKSLEEQTGLKLFDRSGYRNKITHEGEIVLKFCRQILTSVSELEGLCKKIKGGWEPSLKLIYDGVVDFNQIGEALLKLSELRAPTEVRVLSAHLNEVEDLFDSEEAELMVTILPLQKLQIPSLKLKPIRMNLVAHAKHPLSQHSKRPWASSELNRYSFIRIKAPSGQIGLSTEQMKFDSYFYVNDFATKKAAILKRLGFGWLPDYLVQGELAKGTLRLLKTEVDNTHVIHPRLYHRPEEIMGKATGELLKIFRHRD